MNASVRRLRYFLAVADELHFTRAAARLFVSQQSLSRQISELESELGVALFDRTSRRVELTAAGHAFVPGCREALERLDAASTAAQLAGRGAQGTLTVGFFVLAALELTPAILTEYRQHFPDVNVVMREFTFDDPTAGLGELVSDVAIVRLPITLPDAEIVPLFTEPRVVAVASRHRLAGRSAISVRHLVGEPLTRATNSDPAFRRFWSLSEFLPEPLSVINTTSHAEELEVVATGQASSITAACTARFLSHPGVRFVPITDVPGVTTAVARRTTSGAGSFPAQQFLRTAVAVRNRETATIRAIEDPFATRSVPERASAAARSVKCQRQA